MEKRNKSKEKKKRNKGYPYRNLNRREKKGDLGETLFLLFMAITGTALLISIVWFLIFNLNRL